MRSRGQGDDSYQVDAIVALFAIMLLIVVVKASAIAAGTVPLRYETVDEPSVPFSLSSIATPYNALERWVLLEDGLVLLDPAAAIDLLAATPKPEAGTCAREATDGVSGVDLCLKLLDGGGYSLEYFLHDTIASGAVIAEILDPRDSEAIGQWASRAAPARLVVGRPALPLLPALSAAAAEVGKPWSFAFIRKGNGRLFRFQRDAASFAGRGALRVY